MLRYIPSTFRRILMDRWLKIRSFITLFRYLIEILPSLSCKLISINLKRTPKVYLCSHIDPSQFRGVNIIDALSASGLRTIRFLKELNGIHLVYANDISPASHKLMKDNFELNGLDPQKYKMTLEDANLLLQNYKKDIMFDIIDLDPYGSVVPFLDSSV
eukprot:GHVR01117588.1.p1 GENE.GHVR01117588.1~~GHVR01117588.1.p1  ORF type:complete len:159 (+),score=6.73 GHVR01117588.1:737-1213(+)